jgi:Family of unknown function (DUF6114)
MTNAAAPGSRVGPGAYDNARDRFRVWRGSRPFWGAVIAIVAGIEIYGAAAGPMSVVVMQGLPGLLGMGIFLLTLVLGVVTLVQPHLRTITGGCIIVLGPLSIMAINLGGFVVGCLLLVTGGALILAWAPAEEDLDLAYVAGDVGSGADTRATALDGARSVFTPLAAPAAPSAPSVEPAAKAMPSAAPTGTATAAPAPAPSAATAPAPSAAPAASAVPKSGGTGRPSGTGRPGGSKRPQPRTGLAAVFDVMFGSRKSGSRPAPAKRPAVQRPAAKRPAAKRPADVGPAANGKPVTRPGTGPTGSPSAKRPSLDRPADPPSASARTWVLVPLLVVALATPGLLAGPASAAPASAPRSEGPFDWLFPPSTTEPADPAPTPEPTPGLVLPTLPNLLPTLPALPGTEPTPAPEKAVTCPSASSVKGATSPGPAADLAAAALKACVAATGDAKKTVSKAAAGSVPTGSNLSMTLKATKMTMEGFSYGGLATVQTSKGPVETLHFSAESIDIEGMDQTYPFDGGSNVLKNARGAATLKGNVELYVTSFKSNVFGLIPLTFSVDGLQPPLVLPSMFFTDATSIVSLVTCDQILLPDLKINIS